MHEHDEQIIFEMGYNIGFKVGIKGSIPKAEYETRLRADMVAMLTELKSEIEKTAERRKNYDVKWALGLLLAKKIIQEKINALGGSVYDTNQMTLENAESRIELGKENEQDYD